MEVLWDLDTEALEAAASAGIRAVRTATPTSGSTSPSPRR
jgi:ferrochelatase